MLDMDRRDIFWCGVVIHLQKMPADGGAAVACNEMDLVPGERFDADAVAGADLILFEEESRLALERDHDMRLSHEEHGRSITVRSVPLNHLVGQRFRLGEALVEGVALSDSQKIIEERTGKPVAGLLKHRTGLDVRVITDGRVTVGASVEKI